MNLKITDFFRKKNILITGASGLIASAIIDELSSCECNIFRLSRSDLVSMQECSAKIVDLKISKDKKNVFDMEIPDIDIVFHLAAQTSIYEADNNPLDSFEGNIAFFVKLLCYLKEKNKRTSVILASTVTIFGCQEVYTMDESFGDYPSTLYDHEKLYMEQYLRYFVGKGWVDGGSLRLSNVYGSRVEVSSSSRNVISKMVYLAAKEKELTLFDGGKYVRDYIYIDDVVSAFLCAARCAKKMEGNKFIVSTGVGTTLRGAVDSIVNKLQPIDVKIYCKQSPDNFLPIEFRNFIGIADAFRNLTGWSAKTLFKDGIGEIIKKTLKKEAA